MNKNPNFDFYSFNFDPQKPQDPKQSSDNNRGWNPNGSPYGAPTEQTPRNEYGNGLSNQGNPTPNHDFSPLPDQNVYQNGGVPEVDALTEEQKENIRTARRAYSRTGWGFSALMGAWYTASYLLVFILLALEDLIPATTYAIVETLAGSVPLYVFGMLALMLVTIGLKRETPQKQKFGFGAFMFALCAAFTAMVAGSLIGTQIDTILSTVFGSEPVDIVGDMLTGVPLWATILLTAVLAPIFEELIFRRILIPRLLPYGEGMAILLSSLMFGLMHGNLQQLFYATMVGIVLGYVYVRSGKWWLCVLLHSCFNIVGGVVSLLITEMLSPELWEALATLTLESVEEAEAFLALLQENVVGLVLLLVYEVVVYGAAITGLILLITRRRKLRLEPTSCPLPRGYKKGAAFGNVGIIFSLCLCGAVIMLSILSTYIMV